MNTTFTALRWADAPGPPLRLPHRVNRIVCFLTYYPIDTKNCRTRGPSIWRQPGETFASLVGTAYQTRVLEPDGLVSEFESRQVGLS